MRLPRARREPPARAAAAARRPRSPSRRRSRSPPRSPRSSRRPRARDRARRGVAVAPRRARPRRARSPIALLARDLPPRGARTSPSSRALAHAAAGTWDRVVELRARRARRRRARPTRSPRPPRSCSIAPAIAAGALALCWSAIERMRRSRNDRDPPRDTRVGWLRADRRRARRRVARRRRAPARAARSPRRARRRAARRRARGARDAPRGRRRARRATASTPRRSRCGPQLADDPIARSCRGAAGGSRMLRRRVGRGRRERSRHAALAARRRLVDADCAEVAATHAWRALELAAAARRSVRLDELARAVVDAADSAVAERWLDVLELAARRPPARSRGFEARGGLALRWAAAIAERLGEHAPRARAVARVPRLDGAPRHRARSRRAHAARRHPVAHERRDRRGAPDSTSSPRPTRRGRAPRPIRAARRRCSARAASSIWCAATSSRPRSRCSAPPSSIPTIRSAAPRSPRCIAPASATTSSRACSPSCRPR